jgi:hypothetical protein
MPYVLPGEERERHIRREIDRKKGEGLKEREGDK